ncbi:LOW QUALITY PROTEIN: uncharacterized protein LOC107506019 [Rousettus aegyptiacus]|uniref:LOW QUALITY PROTEIN: uncharacterized protein LOC107506019 n=1 Tax=Rousettus aegyptiacus TaxID=9407 RepID=UPI00168D5C6C|nr:LOW QUALITY PROTEIN: uncharacterized protein LOC107506019 [Rousettus aegyptiacus]
MAEPRTTWGWRQGRGWAPIRGREAAGETGLWSGRTVRLPRGCVRGRNVLTVGLWADQTGGESASFRSCQLCATARPTRAGIGRSSTACHWPASLSPSTHSSRRSTETCSMRDAGSPKSLKLAVPVCAHRTCVRSSPASSSQSSSPCTVSASQTVLHAADGIPQEPKVHTQPLLPPELFYSMVSLRKIPLLPPPAPPPSLPVAQFAFTPPFFFADMAQDSRVLRFGVPRQWLDCYPDYVSSHQLGLKTCLSSVSRPPSACCSWRLADGAAGHCPGLWSKAGGRVRTVRVGSATKQPAAAFCTPQVHSCLHPHYVVPPPHTWQSGSVKAACPEQASNTCNPQHVTSFLLSLWTFKRPQVKTTDQICVDFREYVTFFSECSQGSWFTTSDTRSAVTPATFGIPTEPAHQRSCGCTVLPDCRAVRINHPNQNLFLETL